MKFLPKAAIFNTLDLVEVTLNFSVNSLTLGMVQEVFSSDVKSSCSWKATLLLPKSPVYFEEGQRLAWRPTSYGVSLFPYFRLLIRSK